MMQVWNVLATFLYSMNDINNLTNSVIFKRMFAKKAIYTKNTKSRKIFPIFKTNETFLYIKFKMYPV